MATPETISLYGKTYARNARGVVSSLFAPGGTANGTFKATRSGVYFFDLQGKERAFIRKDGLGPVSVTRLDSGKRYYLYSHTEREKAWLGIPDSYTQAREGAQALSRSVFTGAEA